MRKLNEKKNNTYCVLFIWGNMRGNFNCLTYIPHGTILKYCKKTLMLHDLTKDNFFVRFIVLFSIKNNLLTISCLVLIA